MNFKKFQCHYLIIISLYVAYISIIFNYPIIAELNKFFDLSTAHSEIFEHFFYLLVILVLFGLLFIFILLFGVRYLLKPIIILLLLCSSSIFYFRHTYGVAVDEGVILSLFDALIEGNTNEIFDLISVKLLLLIFTLGFIPSIPLFFTTIIYPSFKKEIITRTGLIISTFLVLIGLIASNYKDVSLTARQNKQLNQSAIPHYSVSSLFSIIKHSFQSKPAFATLDEKPKIKNSNEQIIGIVVVGETARADHFGINGYTKQTTPLLQKTNIINYTNAYSCGTRRRAARANSRPCARRSLARVVAHQAHRARPAPRRRRSPPSPPVRARSTRSTSTSSSSAVDTPGSRPRPRRRVEARARLWSRRTRAERSGR